MDKAPVIEKEKEWFSIRVFLWKKNYSGFELQNITDEIDAFLHHEILTNHAWIHVFNGLT